MIKPPDKSINAALENFSLRERRVLMIEDDPYLREYYKRVLEREGMVMDIADDGEQGLEMIKKGEYEIILMDIMLPRMTGIEILEYLKKEKVKHCPIMILTDLDQPTVEDKARQLGAHAYMAKHEMSAQDLKFSIEKTLKGD